MREGRRRERVQETRDSRGGNDEEKEMFSIRFISYPMFVFLSFFEGVLHHFA